MVRQPGPMEVGHLRGADSRDRDFLSAIRERIVVFDGGMGATLEQFDLGPEDYGGLAGKCHEALVAQPPRRDRGRARLDARCRRAGGRDRHLPGLADQARRVGPGRADARDQHQGGGDRPQGRRAGALRRRLDRADRIPARLRRPDPGRDLVRRAGRGVRRAGTRPGRRRRRPDHHRDRAGHPRGQGGGVRRPRGVQAGRPRAADPDLGLAAAPGRQDAARDGHPGGADDPGGARRAGDRAQLLDRPRGHARRDPLPGRDLARCRSTASPTPACRSRARTARRSSPRPPSRSPRCSASSSSATASRSSAAAAGRHPSMSARSRSGSPGARLASGRPPGELRSRA